MVHEMHSEIDKLSTIMVGDVLNLSIIIACCGGYIEIEVKLKENSLVKHLCTNIIVLYNLNNIPNF